MPKFLSYDIEIYNDLPEGSHSLDGIIPSIAATCTSKEDLRYWFDTPYMTPETAKELVLFMTDKMSEGIIPFTWNGCSFDFLLLAQYSGMVNECAELALNGVDGMLLITFNKGYFLGLDTALKGAGLETKTHEVKLNNGETLLGMNGAMAPKLWRDGEYGALREYLAGDVFRPLELILAIERNHGIRWTSKAGNVMFQTTPLTPVKDLFKLKEPDVSWMENPKPRKDFVSWIPNNILNKYGICF